MTTFLLIAVLLVLAAGGAFAVALARQGRKDHREQGQVIPGLASEAPSEWAGAHSPEARMHRRLGQAVRGLRAVAGQPGETMRLLELRVELEQQALEVDRRLIAAAAMPAGARDAALARAEQAVAAVEQAAADLALQVGGGAAAERDLQDLAERIALAGQVRAELEALEAPDDGAAGRDQPDVVSEDTPDQEAGGTTATG